MTAARRGPWRWRRRGEEGRCRVRAVRPPLSAGSRWGRDREDKGRMDDVASTVDSLALVAV